MRFFLRPILCCSLLAMSISAQAKPTVVTDQNHPVYNIPQNVRVIELDAESHLHAELSDNLPADTQQAEQIAKKRLESMGYPFQLAMQGAFQGAVDAFTLGISKIPAVVMDGYVVYGETDVSQAVLKIKHFQEQQR